MTGLALNNLKRCAIYTRKSVNRYLDADVNSLVTQREMCAAYIQSQRYRDWVEIPTGYDDGGHSGSGLERPALTALMQDIEAGAIDTVVVYKIDRLTRSLLDFVRLMEIFDRHGIALVSVTQAFDTSDSMGRMILNVLLTFSQFERELIAERARDGIRTRKRHGKIHGGLPPFGYEVSDGQLIVIPEEANHVRFIFKEFLRTRRYTSVMNAVRSAQIESSVKYTKSGKARGGKLIGPGTVYSILRNPIYVGEIPAGDVTYAGLHDPIITPEIWAAAQEICQERRKRPPHSKQTNHFLAGLLWDDLGRHMYLDVDWHRGKPYFSYASSNATWSQREYLRAYRCNADRLEHTVIASISTFLCDRGKLRAALRGLGLYGESLDQLALAGSSAAGFMDRAPAEQREELFSALLNRIEVGPEELAIDFRSVELRRFLLWNGATPFRGRPADWACSEARYVLVVPVCTISAERWPVVHIHPRKTNVTMKPNKGLIALLEEARTAQELVARHRDCSIEQLSNAMGIKPGFFSRLIRLNYLAPDIINGIRDGTQPPTLDRAALRKANIPLDWALQRKMLGFERAQREIAPRALFGRGMWPNVTEQKSSR